MSDFAAGKQLSEEAITAQNVNVLFREDPPPLVCDTFDLGKESIEATAYHVRFPDSYRLQPARLQDGVRNPFESARTFWTIVELCRPAGITRSVSGFFESAWKVRRADDHSRRMP